MEKKRSVSKKAILIPSIIVVAIAAVALVAFFVMNATINEVPRDAIANNVFVANVDVSGMTKKEAKAEIKNKLKEYQKKTVVLSAEGTEETVTFEDLGFKIKNLDKVLEEVVSYGKEGFIFTRYKLIKDLEEKPYSVELEYGVDEVDIKDVLTTKISFMENQAQNASIKREGGKFVITDGKSGKKVEIEESVKLIQEYFDKEWEKNEEHKIALSTVVDEPDITREELEKITTVLGTYSTYFGAADNRGKNIINATKKLNGILLMPGEEYSVENGMKPFTPANGYYEAGSYLNGKVVPSLGGGVCQVSTTLYNALILAEVEITERHAHSMTIDYVPHSMDAAIAEGSKDLRFKNNFDSPIYVEAETVAGKIVFTVYGQAPQNKNRKVSYVSEILSKTPTKKVYVASQAPIGTFKNVEYGRDAIKAKLWKVVTENGKQVSKEAFNTSNYRSCQGKYEVGIGTDNAEAKKIVQDAIATQDEAKIKAAISQAKAIIDAAQKPAEPSTPTTPPTDPVTPQTSEPQTP
jgi:vancomycin resistance protein YoaR